MALPSQPLNHFTSQISLCLGQLYPTILLNKTYLHYLLLIFIKYVILTFLICRINIIYGT